VVAQLQSNSEFRAQLAAAKAELDNARAKSTSAPASCELELKALPK
jgi:hypothetical protein